MQVSVSQVVAILGGKKSLQIGVDNALDFIRAAEKGFSISVAQRVQQRLELSNKQFSRLLNLSESTFQRRIKNKAALSTEESEKVIELSTIIAKGLEVFEEEDALKLWLNTPVLALGNKKPVDILNSSLGREEVMDILFRIEHGLYS
ncbi:type II toxin-antitoxin system Xre/ParS family antitoxin [Telluribacter sp.]|jgi:putative toxin-antitoxin system antitoxin component (TIGR02293 family)|uniref:type II RES/Xre toxin-antitoxin system antitoxin n=1 Tax=Telluribacter sp. TaxID=1978767 RepID=UPI002E0D3EE4|nr:antitoxin Xre-like helix-turn-helix domain-containing protein [Telluribacter sp.]